MRRRCGCAFALAGSPLPLAQSTYRQLLRVSDGRSHSVLVFFGFAAGWERGTVPAPL
jgi:hypothetical protein